ncbi:MAG: glycosyltransferase family 2 protein [Leuconostoc citreum]
MNPEETNMQKKVTAVIVTYNRLTLLKSSLAKVLSQTTTALKHVIVINGASTDGTHEYLDTLNDDRLLVVHLEKNLGGAGGFNQGIRQFYEQTHDNFVWVMDDDSMPRSDALAKLLLMFDSVPRAGWGASKVEWLDGNWSKMNVPGALNTSNNILQVSQDNSIAIKHATFVSTIFRRELIEKIGLPQKEYFIWGDDIEFTERATRVMPGYFVRDSVVVHESKSNAKPGDIVGETTEERLPRYLYEYRNRILTAKRRQSNIKLFKTLAHSSLDFLKTLFLPRITYRQKKLSIIIKGTYQGLWFHPSIEYVTYSNDQLLNK